MSKSKPAKRPAPVPRAAESSAQSDSLKRAPLWPTIAFGAVIFAITFLTFLPSLRNGFVGWDDSGMFLENIHYRGLKWENIKWMFSTFHYAHYHPITWLTLGLDYEIWGLDP